MVCVYPSGKKGGITLAGKFWKKEKNEQADAKKAGVKRTAVFVWRWLLGLALLAVILLNLFTHIFQIVTYNGTGMEPNLRGGQTLVILKTQKVKQGDVVAFYYNNQVLVRRVVCTGGNQISITDEGVVSINGEDLDEPYLEEKTLGQCNLTFPYHVRSGTVFVMGDNREASMDSRLNQIGTVLENRIIGKVIFTK